MDVVNSGDVIGPSAQNGGLDTRSTESAGHGSRISDPNRACDGSANEKARRALRQPLRPVMRLRQRGVQSQRVTKNPVACAVVRKQDSAATGRDVHKFMCGALQLVAA